MELRMLGRSGLKVSPLCLGGNVFGWTIDEKRPFELLDAFGIRVANWEAIIGNWMKSRGNVTSTGLRM